MIAILWRYEVRSEHRDAFEASYGPAGEWARLFAQSAGFRGTELLRGDDQSYLTIDRWEKKEDFAAFLAEHEAAYRDLDKRTEGWTRSETRLGEFETVD